MRNHRQNTPPFPMPPIKPHKKSRNGCENCKRRKIKCDEVHPCCKGCRKYKIRCTFDQSTSPAASPFLDHQKSEAFSPSHMLDLELMHNYTISTCNTFRPSILTLYQVDLVKEAFKHEYLMLATLALSAFHLASQVDNPSKKETYLIAAHTYHNRASSIFRKEVTNVTKENCNALFCCSNLIFVSAFARPEEDDDRQLSTSHNRQPSLERVLQLFFLIRGVKAIIHPVYDWIKDGPLGPIILLGSERESWCASCKSVCQAMDPRLNALSEFLLRNTDPETFRVCEDAIGLIRTYAAKVLSVTEDHGVFWWPAVVDDQYFELLKEERPEALLIIAYYCTLLHHLESTWWLKKWPSYVVSIVKSKLEAKWSALIQWPLVFMGIDTEDTAGIWTG